MWTPTSFALLAVLCVSSLIGSLCAALFAVRRTALPLAKLRSIGLRMESLEQMLLETSEALKLVTNKVKMQRVRTAANHVPDEIPASSDSLKDRLRKKAGLTAGQPARHNE